MQKEKCNKNLKSGFTLLELLVVVLIIGILAAIAIPQYQKIVLRARLSVGLPLVASMYQAEQRYYMTHGVFATDVDDLDIEIPVSESCRKWTETGASGYNCGDWTVDIENRTRSINFMYPGNGTNSKILYMYVFKDIPSSKMPDGKFKAGTKYCCAKASTEGVCKDMGGTFRYASSLWRFYELK